MRRGPMKAEMDLNLVRESRERIFSHFLSLLLAWNFNFSKERQKKNEATFCSELLFSERREQSWISSVFCSFSLSPPFPPLSLFIYFKIFVLSVGWVVVACIAGLYRRWWRENGGADAVMTVAPRCSTLGSPLRR